MSEEGLKPALIEVSPDQNVAHKKLPPKQTLEYLSLKLIGY